MLLLLLNYVVLMVLWKIDVHLISTLVNKSLYYYLRLDCYALLNDYAELGFEATMLVLITALELLHQ